MGPSFLFCKTPWESEINNTVSTSFRFFNIHLRGVAPLLASLLWLGNVDIHILKHLGQLSKKQILNLNCWGISGGKFPYTKRAFEQRETNPYPTFHGSSWLFQVPGSLFQQEFQVFPWHKPYPHSLHRWGSLHFRYLKCLVIIGCLIGILISWLMK